MYMGYTPMVHGSKKKCVIGGRGVTHSYLAKTYWLLQRDALEHCLFCGYIMKKMFSLG